LSGRSGEDDQPAKDERADVPEVHPPRLAPKKGSDDINSETTNPPQPGRSFVLRPVHPAHPAQLRDFMSPINVV
jgi:hypothetical protein